MLLRGVERSLVAHTAMGHVMPHSNRTNVTTTWMPSSGLPVFSHNSSSRSFKIVCCVTLFCDTGVSRQSGQAVDLTRRARCVGRLMVGRVAQTMAA